MNDSVNECGKCGALSGGEVEDLESGERVPVWWCVACGTNLDRAARGQRPSGAPDASSWS